MASQWFICKNDGQRIGPFTSQALREMAEHGQLLPDDRVWREGLTKPARARKVQGLFEQTASLLTPPPLQTDGYRAELRGQHTPPVASVPPSVPPPLPHASWSADVASVVEPPSQPTHATSTRRDTVSSKLRCAASSFAGSAKVAGQLIAMQAERTKVQKVSLPTAFNALGKHLFTNGRFRNELKDAYAVLDGHLITINQIKLNAAARPVSKTLTDKAKVAAKLALNATQVKVLETKVRHALTELGRLAFEYCGEKAGPPELIQPVVFSRSRVAALDQAIAALSEEKSGQFVTPKRIAIAGVATLVLLVSTLSYQAFLAAGRVEFIRTGSNVIGSTASRHEAEVVRTYAPATLQGEFTKLDYSKLPSGPIPVSPGPWPPGYQPPSEHKSPKDVTHRILKWRNQAGLMVWEPGFDLAVIGPVKHGVATIWLREPSVGNAGQRSLEQYCFSNSFHGPVRQWHENGQLAIVGNYRGGRKHGLWKHWYEDGVPALEEVYDNDKLQGVARVYWENGFVRSDLSYLRGTKHGAVKRWNNDGVCIVATEYVDGEAKPGFVAANHSREEFRQRAGLISSAAPHGRRKCEVIAWQESFGLGSAEFNVLSAGTLKYECSDGVLVFTGLITNDDDIQKLTFSEKTAQRQSQQFDDGFAIGEKMVKDVVPRLHNASPQLRNSLIDNLRNQYANVSSTRMKLRQSGYSDESEGVLRYTGICAGIRETAAKTGIDVEN